MSSSSCCRQSGRSSASFFSEQTL